MIKTEWQMKFMHAPIGVTMPIFGVAYIHLTPIDYNYTCSYAVMHVEFVLNGYFRFRLYTLYNVSSLGIIRSILGH